MPWLPELFSAPALQRVRDRGRREELVSVPYFDGFVAGEPDALLKSFAHGPQVLDPVRGRITGEAAFIAYVEDMSGWLAQHHVAVEDVSRVIFDEHGFEEVILHFDGDDGRVSMPVAIVSDHPSEGLIEEMRIYYRAAPRPPLLQPDPSLRLADVVAEYLHARAAGDTDAIVAAFEPDGVVRDDNGRVHADVRAFYAGQDAVTVELCTCLDDGRACAVEYNTGLDGTWQAGLAVYVRGVNGRLAAARIYDDATVRRSQPWSGA